MLAAAMAGGSNGGGRQRIVRRRIDQLAAHAGGLMLLLMLAGCAGAPKCWQPARADATPWGEAYLDCRRRGTAVDECLRAAGWEQVPWNRALPHSPVTESR